MTISARLFVDGQLREVTCSEALAAAPEALKWIDVVGRDPEEIRPVAAALGLHPLAVDDVLGPHQRPKLEDYGDHLFVVVYGLGRDLDEADDEEIDVFVSPRYLVTVRDGTTTDLEPVRRRLRAAPPEGPKSGWLAWALLDEVVDGYFKVVDKLEDDIDDLEELVFATPRPPDVQVMIYQARKELLRIRRRISPVRDILSALIARTEISGGVVPYLQDVFDHILRITENIDTFRELLSSAHDSYLTEVSNDMNRVMKRFTSLGAIFIMVTLVAGIYGMNFDHMPELGWRYGYVYALVLMAALSGGLYAYFKRRDWL